MSKAFDTVERGKLFEILMKILDEDELHLMKVLLQLQVRIGNQTGKAIKTNIGVPQGDCLSPVLFTLYLANALAAKPPNIDSKLGDHNYSKPPIVTETLLPKHLQDHSYATKRDIYLNINLQYSDDISGISNADHKIEDVKKRIPNQLESFNLHVNESKTEEHRIKRGGNDNWKKCKYLGTLQDTNSDISRRKCLAILAFNKLKIAFNSKLTIKNKIRIFNAYIESIFLYNAELWTLTKRKNTCRRHQHFPKENFKNRMDKEDIEQRSLFQNKNRWVEQEDPKKETAMDRPPIQTPWRCACEAGSRGRHPKS